MAKYSYEFKLQVVQAYLDGEGGSSIPSTSMRQLAVPAINDSAPVQTGESLLRERQPSSLASHR